MSDVAVLAVMKGRELRNRLRLFRRQSRFKFLVIGFFSLAFWICLYRLFATGMKFIMSFQLLSEQVMGTMFYIFFFALSLMLVFSNAIIGYTSYFKSKEASFLLASPVRAESIFLYKFAESLAFSSWAFLFLGTPLMTAYGQVFSKPWYFYATSLGFFVAYMFIPAAIGSIIAMVVTTYLPRTKKGLVVGVSVGLILVLIIFVTRILSIRSTYSVDMKLATEVIDSMSFSENPILPSYWIAKGILTAGTNGATTLFFLGLVAVNAIFLVSMAHNMSAALIRRGWFVSQGLRRSAKYQARGLIDLIFGRLLFWVNRGVRLIVVKDVKSFIRDPVQWSQFLIFFGLLGIYFLNLRTFAYEERDIFWKNLIAQMNLLATSLTLATFASRFIFPQLSLEGRRFWVIGMVPMAREDILYGKLALSFTTSILISETLIGVSSYMLQTPATLAMLHAVALGGICLGLSGLSVGLGAVYPDFTEDNPSKIVSGFGGTLNLVLSLMFVVAVLVAQAVPCFMYFGKMVLGPDEFRRWIVASMGAIAVLSLTACLVPMGMGLRAIRRLEL